MRVEDWADQIAPQLRKNLRSLLYEYIGRQCDLPHVVHECLLIIRQEFGAEHDETPTQIDPEGL